MKKILLLLLVLLTFIPQVFACVIFPEPISFMLGNVLFLLGLILIPISLIILIMSVFIKSKKESLRRNGKKGFYLGLLFLIIGFVLAGIFSFVLAPGCGQPPANISITNALQSVSSGGMITTQEFYLAPGEIISSYHFTDIGFDSTSILFYGGEFELSEKIESGTITTTGTPVSFIRSISKKPTLTKASVICASNGTVLYESLIDNDAGIDFGNRELDTSLCTNNNAQPCCAVVLVRK